jgi:hypothetical protein
MILYTPKNYQSFSVLSPSSGKQSFINPS